MSKDEDDKLDKILEEIAKMNRGLYGDPHNKVPGLMQSHFELRADFDKEKKLREKKTWVAAGFSSAFTIGLPMAWESFKKWLSQ